MQAASVEPIGLRTLNLASWPPCCFLLFSAFQHIHRNGTNRPPPATAFSFTDNLKRSQVYHLLRSRHSQWGPVRAEVLQFMFFLAVTVYQRWLFCWGKTGHHTICQKLTNTDSFWLLHEHCETKPWQLKITQCISICYKKTKKTWALCKSQWRQSCRLLCAWDTNLSRTYHRVHPSCFSVLASNTLLNRGPLSSPSLFFPSWSCCLSKASCAL